MDESIDVQEGFLCPLCMKDLGTQKLLETHFIDEHSIEDPTKGQNFKGIFDKAKRKIFGKGEEDLEKEDYGRNEKLQMQTAEKELDFSYWEPQEIGFTQDHTNEFRRARTQTTDDVMIETSTILIRLEKILNALTDAEQTHSLSSSKKKAKEQSMVPWISDDDAKLCFGCKKSFTVARRKHHCRLCGQVICGKCSEFLPLSLAATICEMDGAQDVILSLDDDESKQKNALRVCYQNCYDLLLKNYEIKRQKKKKTPLVQLYEKITTLMADADHLLPDFNKMAESLSFGDTRYTYQEVIATRLKLLKIYETLELVSKKVISLGQKTTTAEDGTTKTVMPGNSSQKLQRGIHAYVTNYLQNNMFTLKSIPSEEEYVSLQKERAILLKRRAEREKAQQEKAMKERALMHQEVLRRERHSLQNSPVTRRREMNVGQRRRSLDTQNDAILQQINNVNDFLDKARENEQWDEVRSLERNLNELQLEYNKRIRRNEAAHCPDIVVASIDCSVFTDNQDPNFITVEAIKTSEDNKEPSAVWKNEQVSAFAEIRQFLARQKALLKEKKVKKRKLPGAENEEQWFQLCFGKKQQTTVQCKGETQNTLPSIETEDEEHSGGTPALLSIICQMNQSSVLTVLDHHVGWMETQSFNMLQGQWIYALLTAIEKPLLPDTTYSLRRLARLCAKQKESLTPEQTDEMAALFLIIILVMRYFGQSDLAETL